MQRDRHRRATRTTWTTWRSTRRSSPRSSTRSSSTSRASSATPTPGTTSRRGPARSCCGDRPDGAAPGVERGLRLGRGGVQPRDLPGRGAGAGRVPRPGEDLRDRRRRGGAGPGPAGHLHASRAGGPAAGAPSSSTSTGRPASRYTFRKDLRRCVIFGRNDLVQDAPISRIDLLACRNTLMYFNAETQARILHRLALRAEPHGRPVPRQGRDAAGATPTCSCRWT